MKSLTLDCVDGADDDSNRRRNFDYCYHSGDTHIDHLLFAREFVLSGFLYIYLARYPGISQSCFRDIVMMNTHEYVANSIKRVRTDRNLSQSQFADAIGTHANTVSRWETCVYQPSIDDLVRIGNVYNVSVRHFFPYSDDSNIDRLTDAICGLEKRDIDEVIFYAEYRKSMSK